MKLAFGVTPGFCEILWRSVGDGPSSEFMPYSPVREDEEWWVCFRYWHTLAIGDLCWLLYEPALTYLNGWQHHPEELDLMSVVNCEVLEFYQPVSHLEQARQTEPEERLFYQQLQEQFEIRGINSKASFSLPPANEIAGWARVRCQRVIPLSQIPQHFETRPIEPKVARALSEPSPHSQQFETERLIGVNFGGDQEGLGEWIIVKSHPARAVYYSFHMDIGRFEICNGPIEERAVSQIL